MRFRGLFTVPVVLAIFGCGGAAPEGPVPADASGRPAPAVAENTDRGDGAGRKPADVAGVVGLELGQPAAARAPAEAKPAEPPAEPDSQRVKAEVGVGLKGRSLDEHEGILVTPARAYFAARERLIFEVSVPKALQLYEATHGSAPRSHEEFMSQVIEPNRIQLPELPPGRRYVYDPETKELMVERTM